jgi:hypothetical protein
MNENLSKSVSLFQKWTKKMSKIDFPKKLLSKKFKIFTTREGNFFSRFFKISQKHLHYVDKSTFLVLFILIFKDFL